MSARNRVFLGILAIYLASVGVVLYGIIGDLDSRYRESAEESMVETASLLASCVEEGLARPGAGNAELRRVFASLYARRFRARIYDHVKERAELRVYVTDHRGIVVFDSRGQAEGQDHAAWRDVARTLAGQYGARSTRDVPDDRRTAVMYVGAPVRQDGRIVGVVSVGKPVRSFGPFIDTARQKILGAGVSAGLAFVVLAFLVSIWLVRPFGLVTEYVRYVRAQRQLSPGRLLRRALALLRAAYKDMRDAMAGRRSTAEYVQTLTHEIKSPLSALRGAAELLQEPLPEAERARFLGHIQRETARIQELVDRLLELAALETRRGLDRLEPVDVRAVAEDALAAARPAAASREVHLHLQPGPPAPVDGDAFLLQRAVANLLDNAIDFSPAGGRVEVAIEAAGRSWQVRVRDQGTGIPDYALPRVFDKFYSLPRPQTQRKSTGLGLAFVREIAELHDGSARLGNAGEGGAEAWLVLPRGD